MTVFVIAAILVVVVILGFAASVERRVRRYRASTAASLTLLTVELERRFVQLEPLDQLPASFEIEPLIAAVEPSGLNSELVRQLVGARSWSKAVRERELGLPVQAAAENALSAAVHAVLSEADTRPNLKSNWAIQGPAGELGTTEQRIAGAVRVYNDNAYRLASLRSTFPTKLVAKAMKVTAPDPFVEHIPLVANTQPQDVPA